MVLRRPRKPKVEKRVVAPAAPATPVTSISQEETSAEELAREIAEIKQKVHADPELLANWIRQQLRQSDESVHLPGDTPPAGPIVPKTLH
ncbi:MAG: hypothetical protein EBT08_14970 [Betaproteobacteria bacterium]|nr:hypothetical protein [Betaproteobacteria bacterium]